MVQLDKYKILCDGVPAEINIMRNDNEYVDTYEMKQIKLHKATEAALKQLRERIVEEVGLRTPEMLDTKAFDSVKQKFVDKANELVRNQMAEISDETRKILVGKLTHDLIGLGDLELILADNYLEDICINSSKEPMWVYHQKHGWLKTNFTFESEEQVANYASIVARRVGRQISNLAPLLDAHLESGERVNAMLFPIANKGHSMTIRKFAKNPWTITRLLTPEMKLMSPEVASLLWLCMQYEMNIIVGGGTASGKTSLLNAVLLFIPPNQRIVSIEDTREIYLPDYLQWVPMVTRLPNPEGKGEVTMLDLMVNALRMRPDRIVVGEIRRQKEAEVLFEAMHTGHSVYSTLHADNAEQVKNRMTTPPINLPENMLEAVHLILVQYRQRRTGIRRTFEVAEIVGHAGKKVEVNVVYRWNAKQDLLEKVGQYSRIADEIMSYSGMSVREMDEDLAEKKRVIDYMTKNSIFTINDAGRIVALYYRDKEKVLELIGGKVKAGELLKKYTPSIIPGETKAEEAEGESDADETGLQQKKGTEENFDMDEWKEQLNRLSTLIKREKKKEKDD